MQFIEPEIIKYVENIWSSTLSLEARQTETSYTPHEGEENLTGCVHIMGAWNGTVSLQCPKDMAVQAASIMFGLKCEDTEMEEIQDALGELANMTGGNLKALLPEPCSLSLPTVAITDYNFRIPKTELITQVNFDCGGQVFSVSVHKKVDNSDD